MKIENNPNVKIKKRNRITSREWSLYSMCAIPMILVFVFCYLPMGGIIIAFKNYKFNKGIFGSDWVGFKNFEYFFTTNDFWRITRNTIVMNLLFIFIGLFCAVGLAILLYELKSRAATRVYQTMLITPHFVSMVIVSYMLYAFLHPQNGILNQFLVNFLHLEKVDWYATPMAWPFILVICHIWKATGMNCVIYYAALMGIDQSLFEAARIDGANKRQIVWHIIVPCLTSLMTIMTILNIGGIFRADFGMFYQLPRDIGTLYPTTDVIDTYIFRTMRVIGDMGMSSAVGLLQSIVGIIMVCTTNSISKKVSEISLF
ncbi:MAG: sugar ABC transporter permease [Clostridia bacterium]|nr:sugar ABC transporter permease [Clostridia bacterium]